MQAILQLAWLIPVLPLLGFVLIWLTPLRRTRTGSAWLAIGLMLVATLLALGAFAAVAQAAPGEHTALALAEGGVAATEAFAFPEPAYHPTFRWAPTGSTALEMGLYIDPLVAAMLAMVTITSTCIHLFSLGYMAHDPRQSVFFSYISLFTSAMLLMCMADNLLLLFMAWELMGLCSYLLIGFWFTRPSAYRAGLKAFITTRVGDVLLMVGLAYLYTEAGTLSLGYAPGQIFNAETLDRLAATAVPLVGSAATAIALLIFAGTVGKSAQFPLHVWLPDAMEGPTPVSALIHAATMVSAGVFLVGRTYPIFEADGGTALLVVAGIGTFTALFAALIAVAQYDIKRILAYSTLSQLGFMVAALGIGGWVAAMFHLLTHAFFKALLFLGSGSVIHAMEATPAIARMHHHDPYLAQQTAQDIRNMGGLRRFMPQTFWAYMAGYLALAGIVPFAGFWSKDEILADALKYGQVLVFAVLVFTAFLTAFYMTRQVTLVFFGTYRGAQPRPADVPDADRTPALHHGPHDDHTHATTPHESPWSIVAPLVVLALFATFAGLLNLPSPLVPAHFLADFWQAEAGTFNLVAAAAGLLAAGLGIAAGVLMYRSAYQRAGDPDPLQQRLGGAFTWLHRKLYIDEFYAATVGQISGWLAAAWSWLDRRVLDAVVNGTGIVTFFLGRLNFIVDDTLLNDGPDAAARGTGVVGDGARRSTTGRIQDYLGLVFAGAVLFAIMYLYVL